MAQATEQTPTEGGRIVTLGTMEDLIKVADELSKPIIHQAPTTPQESNTYYVFDGTIRYQYILIIGDDERSAFGKSAN